jgi:nitrate/nitrite-specific signal transduction histidine kinase
MRERAMLIGADLDIDARAEGGTRVRLIVPHEDPAA